MNGAVDVLLGQQSGIAIKALLLPRQAFVGGNEQCALLAQRVDFFFGSTNEAVDVVRFAAFMADVGRVACRTGTDGVQFAAFLLQHIKRVAVAHGVVEGRCTEQHRQGLVLIGKELLQVYDSSGAVGGRHQHEGL